MAYSKLAKLTHKIDHQRCISQCSEIIEKNNQYFIKKEKGFEEFLDGRTIEEALSKLENENHEKGKKNNKPLRINNNIEAESTLKQKIRQLPENKVPIVIAGGSFNKKGKTTKITEDGIKILEQLIKKVDANKAYFVIGHKMQGYEKAIHRVS